MFLAWRDGMDYRHSSFLAGGGKCEKPRLFFLKWQECSLFRRLCRRLLFTDIEKRNGARLRLVGDYRG
jgi:hypothetical protein